MGDFNNNCPIQDGLCEKVTIHQGVESNTPFNA